MKRYQTFEEFWVDYADRSLCDRGQYFTSLSRRDQSSLVKSFFNDGWCELAVQNIIDKRLDFIRRHYGVDLVMLRIQALRNNRVFLVYRHVWESIEFLFEEFEDYYDPSIIFGGLSVSPWGKEFCRIAANRRHHNKYDQKTR